MKNNIKNKLMIIVLVSTLPLGSALAISFSDIVVGIGVGAIGVGTVALGVAAVRTHNASALKAEQELVAGKEVAAAKPQNIAEFLEQEDAQTAVRIRQEPAPEPLEIRGRPVPPLTSEEAAAKAARAANAARRPVPSPIVTSERAAGRSAAAKAARAAKEAAADRAAVARAAGVSLPEEEVLANEAAASIPTAPSLASGISVTSRPTGNRADLLKAIRGKGRGQLSTKVTEEVAANEAVKATEEVAAASIPTAPSLTSIPAAPSLTSGTSVTSRPAGNRQLFGEINKGVALKPVKPMSASGAVAPSNRPLSPFEQIAARRKSLGEDELDMEENLIAEAKAVVKPTSVPGAPSDISEVPIAPPMMSSTTFNKVSTQPITGGRQGLFGEIQKGVALKKAGPPIQVSSPKPTTGVGGMFGSMKIDPRFKQVTTPPVSPQELEEWGD